MVPEQDTQPEAPMSDYNSHPSADFHEITSQSKTSLNSEESDLKTVGLELKKSVVLDRSRGRNSDPVLDAPQNLERKPKVDNLVQVRDIKSDPELIGFWLQGRSLRTVEAYSLELKRFFSFTGGTRFRDLTVQLLFSYAESLQKDLAQNSQALALATIKSLLSFGFKVGYLEKNLGAFLRIPKRTDQRVRKILDESKVHEMIFSESNTRNRLILRLLYSGGLRVSELCTLKWRDLQERGGSGQVIVRGKGNKQRTVLLSQGTWEDLKSFRNEASDTSPIFPSRQGRGHLSRIQILNIVKGAALRVGLSGGISPHWFRHSHATHALERGASIILVKDTLGHGSITTTQKYLHSRPGESSSQYLGL